MAYTTINKSTEHFNAKIYTGTGSSQSITGVGFQPDFTWIKQRSGVEQHVLFDAIRGVQKYIASNTTAAEATTATTLTAFNSDGFTEGGHGMTGASGSTYASWNWKANGAGSSNTDGSINTTATSANTTAGFSISKYTGTGASATIGHGLGVAPNIIITKQLTGTQQWNFQSSMMGYNQYMALNTTDASQGTSGALISSVNSTTYSCDGNSVINASGQTYIAYCFAEKTGYSKFGSYTGNGNANGTFVYTGMKPSLVIFKSIASGGWLIHDNKRSETDGGNTLRKYLAAHNNSAEGTDDYFTIDILSNGFKLRCTDGEANQSGVTYIYMAFGQSIVGSNNIPCTAR